MGDFSVNFGLQNPNAFAQGFGNALSAQQGLRDQGVEMRQDAALRALAQNPDDPQAQAALMAANPEMGAKFQAATMARRQMQLRMMAMGHGAAAAQAFAGGQPGAQPAPQPGPMAAPAPAMGGAPNALMPATMAAGAPTGAVQPQQPPAAPQQAPQQPGASYASEMGVTAAIDPQYAAQLQESLKGIDATRLSRLAETQGALASAANSLLTMPPEQRQAAAMRMLPQLQQHGVTPQMVQSADLSDNGLQGIIGQAVGIQGTITNEIASREVGAKEQANVETARHNVVSEHAYSPQTLTDSSGTQHGASFQPLTGTWGADGSPAPAGAAGGAGGGGGAISPAAASVASALSGAGFPAPVVAGFMGNFQAEGGYNGAHGDGGSASGIGQWHADRVANFERVIGKSVNQATPADQAKFVVWEMQNPQAAGMTVGQRDAILAAKTPGQAAALIDQFYERSKGVARQTRIAAANAFASDASPASSGGAHTYTPPGSSLVTDDDVMKLAAQAKLSPGNTGFPPQLARDKGVYDRVLHAMANMSVPQAQAIASGTIGAKQDTATAQKTINNFANGPQGIQVKSINAAVDHVELLRQAATALQSGNTPLFNRISQHIAEATGRPAPTNFHALHDFVMDEVTKGIVSANVGVGDRSKASEIAEAADSPAQLTGALDQIGGLLAGQFHGLRQQYTAGSGRADFEQKYLTPRSRVYLQHYEATMPPIRIGSDAEFNSLPPNTRFIGPDGRVRRKP